MLEGLQRRIEQHANDAKLSNDLLSEAQGRLADVVECISEGFALWDPEDRLILCNERFRRLYPGLYDLLRPGLAFEELVREGHTRGVLADPEGAPDAAETRSPVRSETPLSASGLQHADGRWVRLSRRFRRTRTSPLRGTNCCPTITRSKKRRCGMSRSPRSLRLTA